MTDVRTPMSAATRYMCAAAHLDPRFTRQVLDTTLYNDHRAVGGSPGTDLVPLILHCLAAQRRRLWRDLALGVIWLGAFAALVIEPTASGFLVLLGWFVVVTDLAVVRYDVIGQQLVGNNPGSELDGEALVPRRSRRRLAAIAEHQHGNVTVYSGFSPFVGSGFEVGGWSFSINVRRGREELTGLRAAPAEFTVGELYDAVTRRFARLDVRGLSITDQLYAHGRDVRRDRQVLPDPFQRPRGELPLDDLRRYRDTVSSSSVRYYLTLRVEAWDGELVVSTFLRFRRISESLFVECSHFLLPPVTEKLHHIDRFTAMPNIKEMVALFVRSVLRSALLFLLLGWLLNLWRLALRPISRVLKQRSERMTIASDASFDYGAPPTVRERYTATEYRRYFQKLDQEMYAKTVERTLFEVISSFLDDRGIDTSALEERQSMVLNNGVIVTGGTLAADNVVAGTGAKATSKRTPNGSAPSRLSSARRRSSGTSSPN
jgi:hypothetical protein